MGASEIISIFALVIAVVSLGISFHFGFRDKAHLKTSAEYYPGHPDYDRARIQVKIVNSGRRPTILTMFGGNLKSGSWCGTHIGEKGEGVRLGEHEKHEVKVYREDLDFIDPEGNESEYTDYWFEDTLGQRFKVRNSEKLIIKLKNNEETR